MTVQEKLAAVERAIVSFRWARNDPESVAGRTYAALREVASEYRAQLPAAERSIVVVRS